MKLAVFLAFFALAHAIANTIHTREQFHRFMEEYNVKYETEVEADFRFATFLKTLERIQHKNEISKNAKYGVTKYADRTEDELLNMKMPKVPAAVLTQSCLASGVSAPHIAPEAMDVPTSYDWRSRNVVTPVKNQGQCGSCWTFSTTGNIESLYAIAGKGLIGLSEQEIVDCSTACSNVVGYGPVCNSGCNGGWPWAAMGDIMTWGGLETEAAYGYEGYDQTCARTNKNIYAALKNFTCIGTNETQMVLNLLARGPLSVALDATLVEDYTSGIIDPWFPDDECDPTQLDHAVLIVGYGVEAGDFSNTPFWIVKNSWGADWGEAGYFRIYRGDGVCGINNAVSCAILDL